MKNLLRWLPFAPLAIFVCFIQAGHAQLAPNYSNANLNGVYAGVSYNFNSGTTQVVWPPSGVSLPTNLAAPLGFESDLGTVTFDGIGNVTVSITRNRDGVISTQLNSGTYNVAADGTLTGTGNFNINGIVVEGGRVALLSQLVAGNDPEMIVLVKQQGAADNTATGANAMLSDTSGIENTAMGAYALYSNTTASNSAAIGYQALYLNTTGVGNSAVGSSAMYSNTTGANNTAFGYLALYSNTIGKGNAAQGVNALYNNTSGIRNLGIGSNALYGNTSGGYNIALGFDAGYNVTTGSNNIEIGSLGTASDNGTIQIGVQGTQTSTKIAGIYATPVSGSAVFVTSTGQLGVQASSERYKTDITSMADLSGKLQQLRPVTFHYKTDPTGIRQYGLIAEEVDKVYPELVIRDDKGQIQGVHYEELAPILLNEIQRQAAEIHDLTQRQDQAMAALTAHAAAQDAELNDLKQQLRAALSTLGGKGELVAQR